MSVPSRYNIRVYGILLNDKDEVLLSHEYRFGKEMLKFPGGGNEFGEGLSETLVREFQEELRVDIEVGELFYVNDFYQQSAFRASDQLISFYYIVHLKDGQPCPEIQVLEGEGEVPIWKSLSEISVEEITFPIDRVVAEKLVESHKKRRTD